MKVTERQRFMLEALLALTAKTYMRMAEDVLKGLVAGAGDSPLDPEEVARQYTNTSLQAAQLSEMFSRLPAEDILPEPECDTPLPTMPTTGVQQ